jgi:hypothetical protein
MVSKILLGIPLFVHIAAIPAAYLLREYGPYVWGSLLIFACLPFLCMAGMAGMILGIRIYDFIGVKIVMAIAKDMINEGFQEEGLLMLCAYKQGMEKRVAKIKNEIKNESDLRKNGAHLP